MTSDPAASVVEPADGTLLTARGVRSREALLAAARRLFRAKGYANTKIADITDEAGRALGSFYTYFENKEAVLEQLAEDFKAEVEGRLDALDLTTGDPHDVVQALCTVYWNSCRDHSAELAAIFQASMLDDHFARRWREIRSDARRNLAEGIRAVEAAGLGGDPDPDPEITASALGSMMDYFCYVWLVEGGEADRPTIPDDVAIATMVRVMYRTVFAAPELPDGPEHR
jgi:AcrR family transcriptional regulator